MYPVEARENLATIVGRIKTAASMAHIVNRKRRNAPARKNLRPRIISTSADTVSWYAFWRSARDISVRLCI